MCEKDTKLGQTSALKTAETCWVWQTGGKLAETSKRHLQAAPIAAFYGPRKLIRVCNFRVFIFSAAPSEPGRMDERLPGRLIGCERQHLTASRSERQQAITVQETR